MKVLKPCFLQPSPHRFFGEPRLSTPGNGTYIDNLHNGALLEQGNVLSQRETLITKGKDRQRHIKSSSAPCNCHQYRHDASAWRRYTTESSAGRLSRIAPCLRVIITLLRSSSVAE